MKNIKKFYEYYDTAELRKNVYRNVNVKIDNNDKIIVKLLASVEYLNEYEVIKTTDNSFTFARDYKKDSVTITLSTEKNNMYTLDIVNGSTMDVIFKPNITLDKAIEILNSKEVKKIIS